MSPYRAPADSAGPTIELRDIPLRVWSPTRTLTLSRTFDAGRVHAFVGPDRATSPLMYYAALRVRPEVGSVRATPEPATPCGCYEPAALPSRRWWHRLFGREPARPAALVQLETALAASSLAFVWSPFLQLSDAERPRAIEAIRAARARGGTVLVGLASWRDALALADVFHVFDDRGAPAGSGDLDTVFRPRPGDALSPDAIKNQGHGMPFVELGGVRIPLAARGHETAVDGRNPDGTRTGFITWTWTSWFHVPASAVVLDPTFAHGTPSGSPELNTPPATPVPRGVVVESRANPGPIDRTARWIVLEGKVTDRMLLGDRLRVRLVTHVGHAFHADLPPAVDELGETVRFGFDSAHVVS